MSTNSSQQDTSLRNRTIGNIRKSLKSFPIVRKRSMELQDTIERNKNHLRFQRVTGASDSPTIRQASEDEDTKEDEFFNIYDLGEKIGEGCNATVYRCVYKPTGRVYAVKKIKIEQEHVLTLQRDFITLKQLNHPSICRYKALYIKSQIRTAFLVMEYLPLPALDRLKIKDEEELRTIVRGLIQALIYLHSRNICHRDIKPENILYNRTIKQVKLIDFGISKKTFLRGHRRDMLTIIGTHLYMAPQIFLGGGYDERVDIWALGVTIYKIITDYTPFQSEYHSDTVKNIRTGLIIYNKEQWDKYSSNLRCFVNSLLKKADQRMSLQQAEKHLWMQEAKEDPKRVRRMSSHDILMNESFHAEFNNILKHSVSKEEGSSNNEEGRMFKSKVELRQNFQLEDSQDEDNILTDFPPVRFKSKTISILPSPARIKEERKFTSCRSINLD